MGERAARVIPIYSTHCSAPRHHPAQMATATPTPTHAAELARKRQAVTSVSLVNAQNKLAAVWDEIEDTSELDTALQRFRDTVSHCIKDLDLYRSRLVRMPSGTYMDSNNPTCRKYNKAVKSLEDLVDELGLDQGKLCARRKRLREQYRDIENAIKAANGIVKTPQAPAYLDLVSSDEDQDQDQDDDNDSSFQVGETDDDSDINKFDPIDLDTDNSDQSCSSSSSFDDEDASKDHTTPPEAESESESNDLAELAAIVSARTGFESKLEACITPSHTPTTKPKSVDYDAATAMMRRVADNIQAKKAAVAAVAAVDGKPITLETGRIEHVALHMAARKAPGTPTARQSPAPFGPCPATPPYSSAIGRQPPAVAAKSVLMYKPAGHSPVNDIGPALPWPVKSAKKRLFDS